MKIAIGSDHGGYKLKEEVKTWLISNGYEYEDFGTYNEESRDYPDYAYKVAQAVVANQYEKGILICGTGIGIGIAANKIPGIRAALCHDTFSARAAREHNDANILTMGERIVGVGLALDIVKVWLESSFSGEDRHLIRLEKLTSLER